MDKSISITAFTSQHIEKAIEILSEYNLFHSSNFPDYFKDTGQEEEIDYFKTMLGEDNNYGYVAMDGNEVVGFALFGLTPKPSNFVCPEVTYIYEIVIKDGYRSHGIGKEMLRKIVEFSKTRGIDKIELEIKSSNQRGIDFYKREGFYDYSKTMFLDI